MTIDWWTLAIQSINVVILVWLLGRFFWRPVAAMIEQRRDTARRILSDAEAKRAEATGALADIERTRAGMVQEREAIIAAALAGAAQARTELLAAAAEEADALRASARAAIDDEREKAQQGWADRSSRLAVDIAARLAARLEGPTVRAAFLDWLLREVRGLPVAVRDSAAENGAELEAISAAPIEPADQGHYRQLICEAFGSQPQLRFKVDPGLIAGLELRGPHLIVNNSWRADLDRILRDLTHENRP